MKYLIIDFSPFANAKVGSIVKGKIAGILGEWAYSHNIQEYGNTYQVFILKKKII